MEASLQINNEFVLNSYFNTKEEAIQARKESEDNYFNYKNKKGMELFNEQ